jgi:DNA-directed RNA polymerase specialized sigma24 family protein
MKVPLRLRVGLQVTGSYFGIFLWLVAEYFRELRNSMRQPRTHFDDEIREATSWHPPKAVLPSLEDWVEQLSRYERNVLLLYYHEGLDFAQIGQRTGLDAREVVKIHANLLNKIRDLRPEETTGSVV